MKGLWLVAVVVSVVLLVWGNAVAGNTQFGGGGGLLVTFDRYAKPTSVGQVQLGVSYRPDVVSVQNLKVKPSRLMFWTDQAIIQDGPDMNLTGLAVRLTEWEGVEFMPEVSVMVKGFEEEITTLGGYAGMRMPFSVNGQGFEFRAGGGWVGDPVFLIKLGFITD